METINSLHSASAFFPFSDGRAGYIADIGPSETKEKGLLSNESRPFLTSLCGGDRRNQTAAPCTQAYRIEVTV